MAADKLNPCWEVDLSEGLTEAMAERVIRVHGPMVLATCHRTLNDHALAKDAAQEVFVLLARRAQSLPKGTLLGGWLYRTARHIALRARRSAIRREFRESSSRAHEGLYPEGQSDLWRNIAAEIDAAMETLPQRQRDMIVSCYFEGQSQRQIAKSLGMSESKISREMGGAMEALRRFLEKRGIQIGGASLSALISTHASPAVTDPQFLMDAMRAGAASTPTFTLTTFMFVSNKSLVAAVALAALAAVSLLVFRHPSPASMPSSKRVSQSQNSLQAMGTGAKKPSVKKTGQEADRVNSINFEKWNAYLDTLCPRLSEAEQEKILRMTHRDPKMLLAMAAFSSGDRARHYLDETLQADPTSKLAMAAALSSPSFSGDKMILALGLDDAFGHQQMSQLMAERGAPLSDIAAELKAAAQAPESTFRKEFVDVEIQAYTLAGRDPDSAMARLYMQPDLPVERAYFGELTQALEAQHAFDDPVDGIDLMAQLLRAAEAASLAPGADFQSYMSGHATEVKMLTALQQRLGTDDDTILPVTLREAQVETANVYQALDPVLRFWSDKGGIFQQLSQNEQTHLVERIAAAGEVTAFEELLSQRPDIFNNPEFVPQGHKKNQWLGILQARNR